jgi:hypothetical protein
MIQSPPELEVGARQLVQMGVRILRYITVELLTPANEHQDTNSKVLTHDMRRPWCSGLFTASVNGHIEGYSILACSRSCSDKSLVGIRCIVAQFDRVDTMVPKSLKQRACARSSMVSL